MTFLIFATYNFFLILASFDMSCYTAVVQSLTDGDKIFIEVLELDRKIATENGKSFFGIILLSS
jgi:hypothetical protein